MRGTIKALIASFVSVGVLALVPQMAGASRNYNHNNNNNNDDEAKVTICHRGNSATNPYQMIDVDESAVNGHGEDDHTKHTGPVALTEEIAQLLKDNKTKWGDIIPNILNWDSEGMAVYENDCDPVVLVTPAEPTFKDATCSAKGSYTIPETENVEYLVDGEVVAAGTYEVANGTTVKVTAQVTSKAYYIETETTAEWSHEFKAPTCPTGTVLGTATTTTTPQVASTPVGAVNAGVGSTSSSFGFLTAISMVATGIFLRRRLN